MPLPTVTAVLVAVGSPWPLDADLQRKLLGAAIVWAVALATVPRARRWMTVWPLLLLLLAPVPYLVALLFPESAEAPALALDGCHFFLLASLLQSALVVFAVSLWERFASPWPRIFLDVFRWVLFVTAFAVAGLFAVTSLGYLYRRERHLDWPFQAPAAPHDDHAAH